MIKDNMKEINLLMLVILCPLLLKPIKPKIMEKNNMKTIFKNIKNFQNSKIKKLKGSI